MAIVIGILIVLGAVIVFLYGFYKYKNRMPQPDYFEYYMNQDKVPEGKVGVLVSSLIMTENHSHAMFHNFVYKIFDQVVPWPFRKFAYMDKGVALMDPAHVHAREEFTPTRLEDPFGNDRDYDGYPWMEKYKKGEITWVPPSKMIYLDHGYFLYKGHPGGEPTTAGKMNNRSRLYYYDHGIVQKKIPHWKGSFEIINGAFDRLKQKYPDAEYRASSSILHYETKKAVFELLDAGCNTIVISSTQPIYSHFEEFNSGFRHCFEYIEEWEHEHPGKKVKKIIAPQTGDFQPMRQAFLEMLKDRLDTLPEGADVMVAVTVHGMPWDRFSFEGWLKIAPAYRDKLFEECKELVKNYKFGRTDVVICQDEFSDPIWDPKQKYLSTNRAYWAAIKDGYDYAIGLPIEFLAENTDTLMHHAMKNYENFDAYDIEEPIDYPDWSVPYTREMVQGKTRVIYNGVPVGKYQKHVIEALYQSIDSIQSQKK